MGEEEKWVSSALMAVSAGVHGGGWLCAGPVLNGCSVGAAHSVLMVPRLLRKDLEVESSVMAPVGTVGSASDSGVWVQSCAVTDQSKATDWGGLTPFWWPPFLSSNHPALFHVVLLFTFALPA